MAIFGSQVIITLVIGSFLRKICPIYSLGRWLLCKGSLVRYLHPSNKELRKVLGKDTASGSHGNRGKQAGKGRGKHGSESRSNGLDDVFNLPRSTDVQLSLFPVSLIDVMQLRFYSDFIWLLDFALCTILVFILSDVHGHYFPLHTDNMSLHLIWCFLLFLFSVRALTSLTSMYAKSEDSGELVLVVVSGFFFLVLAMAVMIVDDQVLEFEIESAYLNFSSEATEFLKKQDLTSFGPMSLLTAKGVLSILCSITGAVLFFPGLRFARIYQAALLYAKERPFLQALLHLNFLSPLLCMALWVKPIARDLIVSDGNPPLSAIDEWVIISEARFNTLRIALCFLALFLRLCLLRVHLQAHLNSAHQRLERLKKEAGNVTNIALQKFVSQTFYWLCIVCTQYVAPMMLCTASLLMLKSLGGLSWSCLLPAESMMNTTDGTAAGAAPNTPPAGGPEGAIPTDAGENSAEFLTDTAAHMTLTLSELKRVFTPAFWTALLQFTTWWCMTCNFLSSMFGVLYYSYIVD